MWDEAISHRLSFSSFGRVTGRGHSLNGFRVIFSLNMNDIGVIFLFLSVLLHFFFKVTFDLLIFKKRIKGKRNVGMMF